MISEFLCLFFLVSEMPMNFNKCSCLYSMRIITSQNNVHYKEFVLFILCYVFDPFNVFFSDWWRCKLGFKY